MGDRSNVTINDNVAPYTTIYENTTLSIIYFNYEHSTLEIRIVPEFAPTMILLFLLMLTLFACYLVKKQRVKTS
jgi:hypothetical protein